MLRFTHISPAAPSAPRSAIPSFRSPRCLRAYARADERELPAGVVATIRATVQYQPPSLWERLSAAFRPAVAVPIAIAIAAFIYFGFRLAHGPAVASTIDASYYVESHAALSSTTPLSEDEPIPGALRDDDQSR